MGIMQTCCCCHLSVRKGSYVSAIYTILYFLAFALLTGNMAFLEIRNWQQGGPSEMREMSLGPPESNMTAVGAAASAGITGTQKHKTSMTITKGKGTLDENYEEMNYSSMDDHRYGHTQSPPFSVILLLLDLSCEVTGFFASILLIRGLGQERKGFLIPWMIVVPIHTLIDAYTAFDIVIAFIIARYNGQDHVEDSFGTLLFFTLTVSVASVINIYALLCVVSQYQEYSAGRGTAAHEVMLLQNGGSVRYTSERTSTRPSQKSDIWCDDLVFSKSKNRGESQGSSGRGNPGCSSSGTTGDRIPTVRFENETSSSSGDSAEPRHRFLGKKSNNDPCGRNLIVPCNNSNRSGHSTPTLMEEQSTTADSIDEL